MMKEPTEKQGWQKESGEVENKLVGFFQNAMRRDSEGGKRYDSISELHISGGSSDSTLAWHTGSLDQLDVKILYESGVPTIVHGYGKKGDGQGTDVYLKGRALDDFLEFLKSK